MGMLIRTITGLVAAAIALTILTLPQPIPIIFIGLAWFLAIYELGRTVKAKPIGMLIVLLIHLSALAFLTFVLVNVLLATISGPTALSLYVIFWGFELLLSNRAMRALIDGKERVINFCWHSLIFITLPMYMAAWVSGVFPHFILVLLLGLAAANDTGAVFAGKLFGRLRICKKISPNKTLEGVIGGFAAMFALLTITSYTLSISPSLSFDIGIDPIQPTDILSLGIGSAWLAFVAFIGDITFSAIKRKAGIKDFGAILPGHGGILDRIDAMLFIAPWYFLAIYLSPIFKVY